MKINSPINPDINLVPFLVCKDHTVSRETFNLLIDKKSDFLITYPQPKEEDLGKYYESEDYISHTDASKSFTDKLYQIAKKYAISKKINLVNKVTSKKSSQIKLLDIGCGTGDFLDACNRRGFIVTGIEPNKNAKKLAIDKIHDLIVKNALSDLDANLKYDVITMWHVLEHVPNLNQYVLKLKSLLQKDGVLIIAVPNFKSYDAKYYKEFWAAYDVPRHLWHFSKKAISDLFGSVDIKVKQILPMRLDSFYVSLLSEKYKNGKMNFIKSFLVGLRSNCYGMFTKEYSSQIYILKNKNN